jgi:hypothetical protein
VAGGAAQVHQATAGEQGQALAAGEDELIHLRLDFLLANLGIRLQPAHHDFAVEVAHVCAAQDGLVLHHGHVLAADDVHAAGGGHEDVTLRGRLFHNACRSPVTRTTLPATVIAPRIAKAWTSFESGL